MDERDFTVYQIHSVGFKPSGLAQQWIWFLSDPSLIFIIDSSWKTSGQLPPATLFYPSRKSPEGFGDSVKSRSIHPNQTQPTLLAAFEVQAGSAVLLRVPVWLLMSVSPKFPQLSAPLAQCERPKCPTWAPLNLPIFFRHSSILCLCLFLLKNHFTVLVGTRPKIQTFKLFFTLSLPNLTFYIKSVMWEWFPRRM